MQKKKIVALIALVISLSLLGVLGTDLYLRTRSNEPQAITEPPKNYEFTGGTVQTTPVVAFPGAEGYGAKAKGGRGGKTVYVTNTNDSGVGSLRQALEVETGPRIVMFKVGGTITLKKPLKLEGSKGSFITIAGQTAPGGGIQLRNYGLNIYNGAHDIVIRFLRIRVGQRTGYNFKDDNDAIEMWGGSSPVYNVIIDHVSAEWGLDENISAWENVHDITIQRSIIGESTTLGQGRTIAKGMLIGNDDPKKLPYNFSIHHNLFANNPQRSPRLSFANTDFVNNFIYNWQGNNSTNFGNYQTKLQDLSNPTRVNVINNIWKKGPSSQKSQTNMIWVNKGAELFMQGNWGPTCPTGCSKNEWDIGVSEEFGKYAKAAETKYRKSKAFAFSKITITPTKSLQSNLMADVGAIRPYRDAVDARIIKEVINGTGKAGIGSGFPTIPSAAAPKDADADGIADAWEKTKGLNSSNKADAAKTAPSGYVWLEEYINSLAL